MEMQYKNFEVKAESDDFGKISGYFSTYDRIPDSYGDIVAPGAFAETLAERKKSGHPFPLCWNHNFDEIIGTVDTIEDTEKGPLMKASFFNTQSAQERREIVKSGCVYQFSFAYRTLDEGKVTLEDGTEANELRKVKLYEVSIVPVPANPRAVATDVKSGLDEETNEAIRKAVKEEIEKMKTETVQIEKDEAKANAAAEEQRQSNSKKEQLLEFIRNHKKGE